MKISSAAIGYLRWSEEECQNLKLIANLAHKDKDWERRDRAIEFLRDEAIRQSFCLTDGEAQ